MKIVTVRTLPGETKEQLILRKLGCKSIAEAINRNDLQDYSGNLWEKLESLAAQEVTTNRTTRKINTVFRGLHKAIA